MKYFITFVIFAISNAVRISSDFTEISYYIEYLDVDGFGVLFFTNPINMSYL